MMSNMVLIFPNHHRAIHANEAAFDFGLNGFLFPRRPEPLRLVEHQLKAE